MTLKTKVKNWHGCSSCRRGEIERPARVKARYRLDDDSNLLVTAWLCQDHLLMVDEDCQGRVEHLAWLSLEELMEAEEAWYVASRESE